MEELMYNAFRTFLALRGLGSKIFGDGAPQARNRNEGPSPLVSSLELGQPFAQKKMTHFELTNLAYHIFS